MNARLDSGAEGEGTQPALGPGMPSRRKLSLSSQAEGDSPSANSGRKDSSHSHDHNQPLVLSPQGRRRIRVLLTAVVVPLILVTLFGLVWLWPSNVPQIGSQPFIEAGQQVEIVQVVDSSACATRQLEQAQAENLVCTRTEKEQKAVWVHIPPEVSSGLQIGHRVKVIKTENVLPGTGTDQSINLGQKDFYVYLDGERSTPLIALIIIYLVLVLAVALKRGLLAMIGLAVSVATIVLFMVPALMSGQSPLLVTLVGVSAMILASVYIAHGVSIKTTTALLGTYFGLAVTTLGALWATSALVLIGSGDDIQNLSAALPQVSLSALMTCGIMIAGIGALNDVTITQASAVWELHQSNPEASVWSVFLSAMRIGRDHIASTVYTLAFAYAGTALPLLMLVMLVDRPWWGILSSGQVAEELARTLVASIGLVLAIPLTTLLGAALAPVAYSASDTDN
ncbi:YibE/F family protein [Boudabousia marimammalium]|uniref:YibE/F family protein n=1 Tax=Boudabousia marimammalium TaxID=156892 RepID=UPI000AF27C40|nr:YibE/F family protein [Boudabousia marimammalium]